MLDENGRIIKSQLPPFTPPLAAPPANRLGVRVTAGVLQVSDSCVNVREFRLVWNGRVFLLYWNEEASGHLHHKCTMLNRHGSRLAYDLPSAALLRATLVSGATNLTPAALPDLAAGYGWGRINLRQTLSPRPPVTLHVRDDCALGPGRSATYRFVLPAGTALLRVTFNSTDPPGPRLVNHLHLTVRPPGIPAQYRGNLWSTTAGATHLSRALGDRPVAADAHEDVPDLQAGGAGRSAAGELSGRSIGRAIPGRSVQPAEPAVVRAGLRRHRSRDASATGRRSGGSRDY